MSFIRSIALAPALLLAINGAFGADENGEKKEHEHGHKYTLDTCAVDGKKLDDKAFSFVYKGHEIKVCSEAEKEAFMKDADANLKKVEEAEKAEKKAEHAEKKSDDKK